MQTTCKSSEKPNEIVMSHENNFGDRIIHKFAVYTVCTMHTVQFHCNMKAKDECDYDYTVHYMYCAH